MVLNKNIKKLTPGLYKTGFTLIELLVVIAIIGILSTLAVVVLSNARAKARDSKRVADIQQISKALELYYADNNSYPVLITPGQSLKSPDGLTTYMANIPSNPSPKNDNGCPNNDYSYGYSTSTNKYALGFCLGNSVSSLNAGINLTTNEGMGNNGLVGWWKFDEGNSSNTSVIDYSGGGNNGTWSSVGNHYTTGKVGPYAGQFNGSSDRVNISNLNINTTSNGKNTVVFWMYWQGSDMPMVFSWGNIFYDLWFYSGCFLINEGSHGYGVSSAGFANNWVHVAVVFNNGALTSDNVAMYINGVKKNYGECGAGPAASPNAQTSVSFGSYSTGGYYYQGYVDDARIYNRELSGAEILALYNATN